MKATAGEIAEQMRFVTNTNRDGSIFYLRDGGAIYITCTHGSINDRAEVIYEILTDEDIKEIEEATHEAD